MLVDLYQNRNTASKTYGKFYGRVFNRETLSLKGFAKHMMEHGKRITYEELVLTLQQAVSCLKELALQGVPVKLDGLGTFSPSIEGVGADSVEEAVQSLDQNIKGVHLRFLPEGAKGDEASAMLLMYNRSEGYVHLLHLHAPVSLLEAKEQTYQGRVYMFIPTSNVADLFAKATGPSTPKTYE